MQQHIPGTGEKIIITVPMHDARRIWAKCFRRGGIREDIPKKFRESTGIRAAGNFCYWADPQEVLEDKDVLAGVLGKLRGIYLKNDGTLIAGELPIMVNVPGVIGWSSTIPLTELPPHAKLVKGRLGKRKQASAQFVAMEQEDKAVYAPLTSLVSLGARLIRTGRPTIKWKLEIFTMHPGVITGKIERGTDMTLKTGLVWFYWDNPGEEMY